MKRAERILGALLAAAAVARGAAGAASADVGEVTFPNSGAPEAQAAFRHGLAQLHNFEYESAAEDFRAAEKTDPGFAMAYWGEAMTHNHPIWMEQDRDAAREVLGRLAPTPEARLARAATEREKMYLKAVEILYGDGTKESRDFRYEAAMKALHDRYPDDPDAASLYALSILGTCHNGRDVPTYMRAAAILERVRCEHPDHPGAAHYLIHSTDDPVHAILGLDAARAYSKIAPDAAHAQHMCSHIFTALGMWDDDVAANETAVGVVNRHRAAAGKPPTFCGHYAFWLEYGYLQQGRRRDARRILEACRMEAAGAKPPSNAPETLDPDNSAVGSFAGMRSRYILDTGDWSGDAVSQTVETGGALAPEFGQLWTTGFAAARRGDLEAARRAMSELQAISGRLAPLYEKAGFMAAAWQARVPGIQLDELRAAILQAEGRIEPAIVVARRAAVQEDMLPMAFGPPVVEKPSHELVGDLMLAAGRPAEARAAYEAALARAPNRASALYGRLRAEREMGDHEAASRTRARLESIWHSADSLPEGLAK
jgi:tetratricopeptide (TPR) repeat protein